MVTIYSIAIIIILLVVRKSVILFYAKELSGDEISLFRNISNFYKTNPYKASIVILLTILIYATALIALVLLFIK